MAYVTVENGGNFPEFITNARDVSAEEFEKTARGKRDAHRPYDSISIFSPRILLSKSLLKFPRAFHT